MQSLHVSHVLDADPDTVFDIISDHAGYAGLPGVRSAHLRQTGRDCRDGVDAERVLRLPLMTLVERITEYEPGQSLGYRIIESPLPIHHLGARVLLQPVAGEPDRTEVHWNSRLRATTRVGRAAVEIAIARQLAIGYAGALRVWAWRLRR